ncbi:MAG: putative ABC transporter permease [Oscillospiraceae bacterium]|nr:putative ABC transporter permease [Oscillospiraceae bacterium]
MKELFIILFGGVVYGAIEIAFRGHTHISMILLGGMCLSACGIISDLLHQKLPLPLIMVASAVAITVLEFIAGCIINLWLGLAVWDYSNMPGNILGQVSPAFTAAWFFLALPAIYLYDIILHCKFSRPMKKYFFLRSGNKS